MECTFAGFLHLCKTYYLSSNNQPGEENFSHNNWIDQFIAGRYHCYSTSLVKEHGTAEAGAGKA